MQKPIFIKLKDTDMSRQTDQTFREQLHTSMNADGKQSKVPYSEKAVTNEPIGVTGLRVVGVEGKYFAALGPAKITEEMESAEAVIERVESKPWEMILAAVVTLIEVMKVKELEEGILKG